MCAPLAIAAVGVAVSAASAVASYSQASSAAKKQGAYNAQVEATQQADRLTAMQYQNDVWEQDINYAGDMLSWAEEEFSRQTRYVQKAGEAIEKNTLAATGQLLLRQVEEDISVIIQGQEVRRTGAQARAQVSAKDRGVEGNSVEAIINDVMRQESEVLNVMAMNRSASLRAINREIIAADAQGDQQLANIQVKTYAPSQQIRSPAPINSVMPAAPVQQANVGQLVSGVAGGVIQGIQNYSTYSGQKVSDTLSDAGKWVSRQFTVTPAGR